MSNTTRVLPKIKPLFAEFVHYPTTAELAPIIRAGNESEERLRQAEDAMARRETAAYRPITLAQAHKLADIIGRFGPCEDYSDPPDF